MKATSLAILLLLSVASLLSACSASQRVQRIARRHPEMLALQAHRIDTLIAVPTFDDSVRVPMASLLMGEAVSIPASQGSFTIRLQLEPSQKDQDPQGEMAITYQARPKPVHYVDTIFYPQIVIHDEAPEEGSNPWLLPLAIGAMLVFTILFLAAKRMKR